MRKHILVLAALGILAASCTKGEHEGYVSELETPIITNDISNQKVTSFAEHMVRLHLRAKEQDGTATSWHSRSTGTTDSLTKTVLGSMSGHLALTTARSVR